MTSRLGFLALPPFLARTSPDPPSPGPCDPPGEGDGTKLISDGDQRCLLDQDVEVVDGFLVLAKLEVSGRPTEPSVEIIRLRLEGGPPPLAEPRRHAPSCWAAEVPQ